MDKKQVTASTSASSTTTTTTSKATKSTTSDSVAVKLPAKTTNTTTTGTKASTTVVSSTKPTTTNKIVITNIKNISVPNSSNQKANPSNQKPNSFNQKATPKASLINHATKVSSSILTITSQTKPSTNTSKVINVPPLRKLPTSSKSVAASTALTTKNSEEKVQYSNPIYHHPEPRNQISSPEQETAVTFTRTISNAKPTLVPSSLPATSTQNDNMPRSTPNKIFTKPQTVFSNAKSTLPSSVIKFLPTDVLKYANSSQESNAQTDNRIIIDKRMISTARGLKDNKSALDEGIKVQRTEFHQDALQRNSNLKQESLQRTLIIEPANRNSTSNASSQRNVLNQKTHAQDAVTQRSTINQGVTQRTIILGGQKEEARSNSDRSNTPSHSLHQEQSHQKGLAHFENHPRNQLESAHKSRLSTESQQRVLTANKPTSHQQLARPSASAQQQPSRVRESPQHTCNDFYGCFYSFFFI